jgi:hypothetical protein
MDGCRLNQLMEDNSINLSTYNHYLANMMCNPPQVKCWFQQCAECAGSNNIKTILENVLEDNAIENMTFKQWIISQICTLEAFVKSTEEFVDFFHF